ncbi:MAG: sulfotransferase domain-containing protein [Pseudomonadota bacterium]
MLFVCNGPPKSGTTWVTQFFKFQPTWVQATPAEFNDPKWSNPKLLTKYLKDLDSYDFFHKNHFYTKVHLWNNDWAKNMLDNPHVRVLSIIRDARDQFVSRYYHDIKIKEISADMSFDDYFEGYMDQRIDWVLEYNEFWYGVPGKGPVTTSYEYLQADVDAALANFVAALKLPADVTFNIGLIKEKTDFSKFKVTGDGAFMRKGQVGDHLNHMSKAQVERLEDRLRKGGYGKMKRAIVTLHPYLEPTLTGTDIGLD